MKGKKSRQINKANIEYICKKCGFIKEYGLGGWIKNFMIALFSTTGIVFVGYFLFLLTMFTPTELINTQVSILSNYEAYQYNTNLRDIGLQYVKDCYSEEYAGMEDECIIRNVFTGLSGRMKYVSTPVILDLEYVYESKYGDCKNLAALYVGIVRQFGIEAYVDSSLKHRHAVAIAVPENKPYYYRIDLAMRQPELVAFNKGVDHWSFYDVDNRTESD